MPRAETAFIAFAFLSFVLIGFVFLFLFAKVFGLWLQAFTSGTPVTVLAILGMRFRRVDANAVVKSLIMARQAGVMLSSDQVERAYLQGANLEQLILAMIQAKKKGKELTFEELVEADLEDRLAEKLGQPVSSASGTTTADASCPPAEKAANESVHICRKCSAKVFADSKTCRNCGAIL